MDTPIALIIFRRPAFTERVLRAIAQVKPRQLFVIADGPRKDHPDDLAACTATRRVIEQVNWDCEVVRNFSADNLGCGLRPASGITWLFEQVNEAIILEDDCLPHPSFFRFCEELLDRYREDERVMHIAGSTYRRKPVPTPFSYCFSQFNGAWGWATWRRAWRHFDMAVQAWAHLRETSWLTDLVEDPRAYELWADAFEVAQARQGEVTYWDHQWTFACWANSGLSVLPRHNLVSNIGCGTEATHCRDEHDMTAKIPALPMSFPLNHPPAVLQRRDVDREFIRDIVLPRLAPRKVPASAYVRRTVSTLCPDFLKQVYRRSRKSQLRPPASSAA